MQRQQDLARQQQQQQQLRQQQQQQQQQQQARKQDKSKDDDDDGPDTDNNTGPAAPRQAVNVKPHQAGPPATVLEFFKRLAQPAPQPPPKAVAQHPNTFNKPPSGLQNASAGATPATVKELIAPLASAPGKPAAKGAARGGVVPAAAVAAIGKTGAVAAKAAAPVVGGRLLPKLGPPVAGTFRTNQLLLLQPTVEVLQAARGMGLQVVGATGSITKMVIPPGASLDAPAALLQLQQAAPSAAASLNYVYGTVKPAAVQEPDDTVPGAQRSIGPSPSHGAAHGSGGCTSVQCFGTSMINWQPKLGACARRMLVGVIDTAPDPDHPAFRDKRINFGYFRPSGVPKAPARELHGTGVLSLLVGSPHSSTPGLIPDADIYVADAFYSDANGQTVSDTQTLVAALEWMEAVGVQVINLSLSGPQDPIVYSVIRRLAQKRVIMVAAAGNEGPHAAPSYPAAYKEVVAVTAVDRERNHYRNANQGSYIDLAAPGVKVWTAVAGHRAGGLQTGTSFATPYVTAVAASLYRHLPVKSKAGFLRHVAAVDLGPPGPDPIYGRGLIQAPAGCAPNIGPRIPTPPVARGATPGVVSASITRAQ